MEEIKTLADLEAFAKELQKISIPVNVTITIHTKASSILVSELHSHYIRTEQDIAEFLVRPTYSANNNIKFKIKY